MESCKMCLKELENKIKQLKEELGIDKDVENWKNISAGIRKIKSGKSGQKWSVIIQSATPKEKPKTKVLYIQTFPIEIPKEEVEKKKEYLATQELVNLIRAYKALQNVV